MEERNKISDAKIISLDHVSTIGALSAKISGLTYFYENVSVYTKNRMVLLTNADKLIESQPEAFREQILDAVQNSALNFLITTTKTNFIDANQIIGVKEKIFTVRGLDTRSAAKMLLDMAKEDLPFDYRNVIALENHMLFTETKKKINFYPSDIINVTLRLRGADTLEDVAYDLANLSCKKLRIMRSSSLVAANCFREEYLRGLLEIDDHMFTTFTMLTMFQNGMLELDCKQSSKYEFFPKKWISFICKVAFSSDLD